MIKFAIFKKSNKFYWSTNKIYYCTLFSLLGTGFVAKKIYEPISPFFLWPGFIVMIIGIYLKIKNLFEIEPLRGILDGELIFEKESIIINNKHYSLNEINKIKISNNDYIGMSINYFKENIGPALSNGTNNSLVIFLKSKKPIEIFFELVNSNDFQKIKPILIEYYLKGKMDFEEITSVLGEKNSSDLRELKEEISKIRNSKNLSNSEA